MTFLCFQSVVPHFFGASPCHGPRSTASDLSCGKVRLPRWGHGIFTVCNGLSWKGGSFLHIWRFLDIGGTPKARNHQFFAGILHYKSSILRIPCWWKPPYWPQYLNEIKGCLNMVQCCIPPSGRCDSAVEYVAMQKNFVETLLIYEMVGKLQVAPNGSPLNRKYMGNMGTPSSESLRNHWIETMIVLMRPTRTAAFFLFGPPTDSCNRCC